MDTRQGMGRSTSSLEQSRARARPALRLQLAVDPDIAELAARVEALTSALSECAASLRMVLTLEMLEPGEELTEVVAASLRRALEQLP